MLSWPMAVRSSTIVRTMSSLSSTTSTRMGATYRRRGWLSSFAAGGCLLGHALCRFSCIVPPRDSKIPPKADPDRINVNDEWELRDWSERFGVSPDELKRAVQQVADRVDAVRQHLGK